MRFNEAKRRFILWVRSLWAGERYAVHGVQVSVPTTVSPAVRYSLMRGRYENAEAVAVRKYLRPGANVIELGGCLGVLSKIIRSAIGESGRHIVVEANPALIATCSGNAVNPAAADRTTVVHAAVAYGVANTARFFFGHNEHVGRLATDKDGGLTEVPAVTLSTLAARWPQSEPFSLVCDIEGAEFALFEHEASVLARVQHVILEIHPMVFRAQGKSEEQFLALVAQRGFRVLERDKDVVVLVGHAAA